MDGGTGWKDDEKKNNKEKGHKIVLGVLLNVVGMVFRAYEEVEGKIPFHVSPTKTKTTVKENFQSSHFKKP